MPNHRRRRRLSKGRSICKRRSDRSRQGRRRCRPDPGRGQLATSGCLTSPPMRFRRHLSGSVHSFTPFCVRCGCAGLWGLAVGPAALWPRPRWWSCFSVLLLPSLWFVCVESSSLSAFCCCVVVLGGCSRLFSLSRFASGSSALSSVGRLGEHRTSLSLFHHRRNRFFSYRDGHL